MSDKLAIVKLGFYSAVCGFHIAGFNWLPSKSLAAAIAIGCGGLAFAYGAKLWSRP